MFNSRISPLVLALSAVFAYSGSVYAEQETQKLDTVEVRGKVHREMTNKVRITREDIAARPTGNDNVTDLLKTNPVVQFSNASETSLQQGEIKPSRVSMHGNVSYQNNYMIDGISKNSDLDPAEQTDVTITHLGSSHEQGFFLDSHLVDSVDVYDSNVPASFGFFKGGVVDAKTRSWQGGNHFSVWGRTTESGWSHIFVDDNLNVDAAADVSKQAQFQTSFTKRSYGATGEFGITDDLGIVVGVSRRESKIPQMRIAALELAPDLENYDPQGYMLSILSKPVPGGMYTETRSTDNAFAKATAYLGDNTIVDWSVGYSNYRSKSFLPKVAASNYEDKHTAWNSTLSINHRLPWARWMTDLSYTDMKDTRISESKNWTQMDMLNPSNMNFTSYASGGLGDLKSTQKVVTVKSRLNFDPIQTKDITHKIATGIEYFGVKASYGRDEDYFRWTFQGMPGMEGSGMMPTTTVWRAGTEKAKYNTFSVWVEDLMQYKRLTVRPGLRIDRDGFNKRTNIAPRFSANVDVFGNKGTIVGVGANRYYGRSLLTYALYKAQNNTMYNAYGFAPEFDDPNTLWFKSTDFNTLNHLRTPYDDELTASLTQRFANRYKASLTYVHRKGKDGVRSYYTVEGKAGDAQYYRNFANLGKSTHDNVILRLENERPITFSGIDNVFSISAAWSKTKSNQNLGQGYNVVDMKQEGLTSDYVMYDGKLIRAEDLNTTDYNIPIKVNLELTQTWDKYGLTWYNLVHIDSARNQAVLLDGEYVNVENPDDPNQGTMRVKSYKKQRYPMTWVWNTKLTYKPEFAKGLAVSLEVNNVLNRKNLVNSFNYRGVSYNNYGPGRQFWLQLNYEY